MNKHLLPQRHGDTVNEKDSNLGKKNFLYSLCLCVSVVKEVLL